MNTLAELRKREILQSNPFFELQRDLDITGLRIMALAQSDIRPHLTKSVAWDEEFRTFRMPAKDVIAMFSRDGSARRTDLYESLCFVCNEMGSATVKERVQTEDGKDRGYIVIPIFQKISFLADQGLEVCFNKEMKPFLLELQNKPFTITEVETTFTLNSPYAIHLLNRLLSFAYHGKRNGGQYWVDMDLDELRWILKVPENAYKGRMSSFRKFVIDNPVAEINKKLPYHITYEVHKEGRKVTGFRFHVELLRKLPALQKTDEGKPTQNQEAQPSPAPEEHPRQEEDPEAAYLAYVTLPRKQGGVFGVNPIKARDWANQLGWERCKLISDSMLPFIGRMERPAGALINAWKRNEPYNQHGNVKPAPTEKKKYDPPPLPDSAFGRA